MKKDNLLKCTLLLAVVASTSFVILLVGNSKALFSKEEDTKNSIAYQVGGIYDITYDLGEGTNDTSNPSKYYITDDDITLKEPTRTGYTFSGWTGTDLTSLTKNVTIKKGSSGDKKYTANWTPNTYKITVVAGTGTSVSGGGNCSYGQTVNFSGSANTNYTWNGWSDGNSAYSRSTTCDGNKTFTTNAGTYNPPTYTKNVTGSNGWSADYTCNNGTGTMTACYFNGTKCDGGYIGHSPFDGCTYSASYCDRYLPYNNCSTSFGYALYYGGGMSERISC